jgi:hypothetical protein
VPNITITNCDSGSVVVELGGTQDGLLENTVAAEVSFPAGTLLAQAAGGHFLPFATAGVAELGVPKFVLTYDVTVAASTTLGITALASGKVNQNRLSVHGEAASAAGTVAVLNTLRDYSIIPVDVDQLGSIDNPQA